MALFGKWTKINLQRKILAKVEKNEMLNANMFQNPKYQKSKLEITTTRVMKYVNAK